MERPQHSHKEVIVDGADAAIIFVALRPTSGEKIPSLNVRATVERQEGLLRLLVKRMFAFTKLSFAE